MALDGHLSDVLSPSRECFSPVDGFGDAPGHRGDVGLLNGEGLHPLTEVVDECQNAGVALMGLWERAWSTHRQEPREICGNNNYWNSWTNWNNFTFKLSR